MRSRRRSSSAKLELAQRPLGFEGLLHLEEERALGHVLGAVGLLDVGVQLLQPPLHGREVGQDQLQLQHAARRAAGPPTRRDGAPRRTRTRAPRAPAASTPRSAGRSTSAEPSPLATPGHVHVLDGGERRLLRVEQRGQRLHPRVGHARDAQPRLGPPARRGRRRAREELEQRALARRRETDDADLHERRRSIITGDDSRGRGAGLVVESRGPRCMRFLTLGSFPRCCSRHPRARPTPSPVRPRLPRRRLRLARRSVILFLVDNSASLPPLDPEEKRVDGPREDVHASSRASPTA